MDDLIARFRDHTIRLFEELGMISVGYWVAEEDPERLVYLLRHEGEPEASWQNFRADPRWIAAFEDSQRAGGLTSSITALRLHDAGLLGGTPLFQSEPY